MNAESINNLNILLGLGAIVLQAFTFFAVILLFINPRKNQFLDFIDKHYLSLGFFISLCASVFPLVYSEIIDFTPCYLCWWQRVFMIPLVFIFGTAIWYKERKIVKYILPIVSIGALISLYHNFMYYFADTSNIPCDASGVSCYQQLVHVFGGYISIPMLALTSFISITVIVLVAHFYKKED